MNIHIFGHSICRRASKKLLNEETFSFPENLTFADMFFEKYNLNEQCFYQADCASEERILYFLKKTPLKIDVAIIFHGIPNYIFCPGLDRDLSPNVEEDFWSSGLLDRFKFRQNILKDKSVPELVELDKQDFKQAYKSYTEYFYTNDLAMNRYYGALIQIDQYLTSKKIPAIHCMLNHNLAVPSWFKFTSGIVDYELASMQTNNKQFPYIPPISANHISLEGNKYIFNKLESYIQELLSNK
jgi:hypothetical protein